MKVDTTAIEQEIAAYEKQLRQHYSTKSRLMEEIGRTLCLHSDATRTEDFLGRSQVEVHI